jgi:hypothetical protein
MSSPISPIEATDPDLTRAAPAGDEFAVSRRMHIALGLTLVLVAGAGIWFRWVGINAQSMWADEGYTTWLTQYSPSVILKLLPTDNHPPLYYFLLHFWRALFGSSVFALRGFSALCSTLCLPVMYLLARRIFNSRLCGLVAFTFASLSFFPIWYAKEVRDYALLELLSCLCVYWMVLTLEAATRARMVVLALSLAALLYTHNMAWFYIPGLLVFWFCYPSEMDLRGRLKRGAVIAGIVFALFAAWIRPMWVQVRLVHDNFWPVKPGVTDLFRTICIYCGIDADDLQVALRLHLPKLRFLGFRTWAAIVLLCLGIGFIYGMRSKDSLVRRKVLAITSISFLPILLVFAYSHFLTSVYINRVLIGAGVFLPLLFLAPVAFAKNGNRMLQLSPAFGMLIAASLSLALQHEQRDDWGGVTRYVLGLREPQRVVFAFQPFCQILMNYYGNQLTHPGASVQITGLMSKADLEDATNPTPGIPPLSKADPIGMLREAIASGRYKEIDVALQMFRLPASLEAMPDFLSTHCASVSTTDFNQIRLTRCVLISP